MTTVQSLGDALESFNRKERNLLIRAALAENNHPALPPLGGCFREKIGTELGLEIPKTAWWATDYHISWIAGALALFLNDNSLGTHRCWRNPLSEDKRRLVERNQEDVDLIVATGSNLILIEAKAYGHFTNKQLEHKFARLELLHKFYKELIAAKGATGKEIQFHFLATSPGTRPERLRVRGPNWACKGNDLPWIQLALPAGPIHSVMQSDKDGTGMDGGEYWSIKSVARAHISAGAAIGD